MREIIFRGKRIFYDEWVCGSLVYCPVNNEVGSIIVFGEEDETGYIEGYHVDVNLNTVGQYTGLTDKNGKKIFEGDVIKYKEVCRFDDVDDIPSLEPENIKEKIGVVKYENGKFAPIPELHYCDDYWYAYGYIDFEVIGNVHDNPELLEVR